MTKIFYDTEFLEDGTTIDLISIGMVSESGDRLYCINSTADWCKIIQHTWLRGNVVPRIEFDKFEVWADKNTISHHVRNFILSFPDPELWAWYGAYDHVALCQLFGPMSGIPKGIPYWTNDLRQEYHIRKLDPNMHKESNPFEHNALADAYDLKRRYELLHNTPTPAPVPSLLSRPPQTDAEPRSQGVAYTGLGPAECA